MCSLLHACRQQPVTEERQPAPRSQQVPFLLREFVLIAPEKKLPEAQRLRKFKVLTTEECPLCRVVEDHAFVHKIWVSSTAGCPSSHTARARMEVPPSKYPSNNHTTFVSQNVATCFAARISTTTKWRKTFVTPPGLATIAVHGCSHFASCLMWRESSLQWFLS